MMKQRKFMDLGRQGCMALLSQRLRQTPSQDSQQGTYVSVSQQLFKHKRLEYTSLLSDGSYLCRGFGSEEFPEIFDYAGQRCDPNLKQEIVCVNEERDLVLLTEAVDFISGLESTMNKVQALGKFVAHKMGGRQDNCGWAEEMYWFYRENMQNTVVTLVDLWYGDQTHRCFFMKWLLDQLGVPARLVIGADTPAGSAMSAVVFQVDEEEYGINLMDKPGEIIEVDNELYVEHSPPASSPTPPTPTVKVLEKHGRVPLRIKGIKRRLSQTATKLQQFFGLLKDPVLTHFQNIQPLFETDSGYMMVQSSTNGASPQSSPPVQNLFFTPSTPQTSQPQQRHDIPGPSTPNQQIAFSGEETLQPEDSKKSLESLDIRRLELSGRSTPSSVLDRARVIPFNQLQNIRPLCEGAYGVVYRATHMHFEVAVKEIKDPEQGPNGGWWYSDDGDAHAAAELEEEFLREVDIMMSIPRKYTVPIHGVVLEPRKCIVTEFIKYGSLFNLLHGRESQTDVGQKVCQNLGLKLKLARDVAIGMNLLHDYNILHLDLKTQNILLAESWQIKIGDYGLSRRVPREFESRGSYGTPEYMAPELLRDCVKTVKADVFSYGVVLWEMVTGNKPWSHIQHRESIWYRVTVKGERLEIPDDPEVVHPLIANLIRRCWAQDPEERPSFEEIILAFEKIVQMYPWPVKRT
eukprot:TRINITY_DN5273_c1_g1_i2.p1 TRINITY_DN5273_c1_g1~~TRINITY_DN5273_c1_g1_i2.p1  ORF type:complete len:717 (+),score=70.08 TRINITY_DN5273_c1_g1_i2:88-2151(+)